VEHTPEFNEQYGAYNHALIGRVFFLSKLEEAAKVCTFVNIFGESTTKHTLVDMVGGFDKRMGEIITCWREFLVGGD